MINGVFIRASDVERYCFHLENAARNYDRIVADSYRMAATGALPPPTQLAANNIEE